MRTVNVLLCVHLNWTAGDNFYGKNLLSVWVLCSCMCVTLLMLLEQWISSLVNKLCTLWERVWNSYHCCCIPERFFSDVRQIWPKNCTWSNPWWLPTLHVGPISKRAEFWNWKKLQKKILHNIQLNWRYWLIYWGQQNLRISI